MGFSDIPDRTNGETIVASWFNKIKDELTNAFGSTVDDSSLYDVASTTKGARPFPQMTEAQRDAISSPANGLMIYNTDTDKLNQYSTSNSTWSVISGGSGGGFNLDSNPYAQSGLDGWAVHADQTDLDGGTTTGTSITAEATSTQILSGDYKGAFKWTLDASDHSDKGISKSYSMPEALKGKPLYAFFRISSDVALTAGDLEIAAYDTEDGLMNVYGLTDQQLGGMSADGVYDVRVRLDAGGSPNDGTSRSIRLGLNRVTTDATATNIYFSDVRFSDSALVDTAIIGYMGSYTPTVTTASGTPTNYTVAADYWRVDDRVIVQGRLNFTGAVGTWSSTFDFTPPPNITRDTSKTTNAFASGTVTFVDAGVNWYAGHIDISTDGSLYTVSAKSSGGAYVGATYLDSASIPFAWGSGDYMEWTVEYPVEEWKNSSAVLSTTAMMNETSKMRRTSTAGQTIPHATAVVIDFENETYSSGALTYTAGSGYNSGTGAWTTTPKITANKKMTLRVNARTLFVSSSAWAETEPFDMLLRKNGTNYAGLNRKNGLSGTELMGGNGTATVELDKGDYIEVTVYQGTGGSLGLWSSTDTYNYIEVEELPDLTVYSVYGETEVVEASSNLIVYPLAANSWGDLTSIDLTAGEWEIYTLTNFYSNAATTTGLVYAGAGETSGNNAPFSNQLGKDYSFTTKSTGVGTAESISHIKRSLVITEDTTIYLKSHATNSVTNLKVAYYISARRIK